MTAQTTPVGIHATSRQALAYTPPASTHRVSDKHVALALDQLAEELELNWSGSPRDQHTRDFIERVDERAAEISRADHDFTKPSPTPFVGVAVDACGLLMEMQTLIANLSFFSPGDTGLSALCQAAERITPIIAKLRSQQ